MSKCIYCTYLTVYSGNKLPPFYIGSSTVEKVNRGYRGSVKSKKYSITWKKELLDNPHLFKTKIITTHPTRKEAFDKELYFHEKLKVVNNSLFINMSYANGKFFFFNMTQEYRDNMSRVMKGRKFSEEHKRKIGEANKRRKGTFSDETKRKMGAKNIGKKWTEEQRQKLKGRVPWNKGTSKKYTKNPNPSC
jgi:hypothetical protein